MGDFNSRTGKFSDNVCQEGNTIITNDQSEFSLCAPQRHSFDNELNNHGKRLLEICRSADLTIMNGRSHGDSLGRLTFHGKSGVSVVDHAICDQDLFPSIANFVVREPSSLSDHSPIMTWPNITKVNKHLATENTHDTLIRLPKQFIWENDSSQKFKTALQTRDMQRMIHDFLVDSRPDKRINSSLDTVERILFTTAKRCLKINKNVEKRYTNRRGSRGGEMGEFSPPFFEPLFNHADAQTSNTLSRLWFYYIITKIHPPFQNPGSAPD